MTKERIYKRFYAALRIFHWIMFFIVVEIMFVCAGWMIFGGIGMILDATLGSSGQESSQDFFRFFGIVGKAVGVLGGIAATRFALGRYTKPNRAPAENLE